MTRYRKIGGQLVAYANAPAVTPPPENSAPAAPVIAMGSVSSNSLGITWTLNPLATAYGVYLNGVKIGADLSTGSFLLSSLTPSTSYIVGVDAVNSSGRSARASITSTTMATPIAPPTPSQDFTSYWETRFPVAHGVELDPAVRTIVGIPPGVTHTPFSSLTINAPGVYTRRSWVGELKITVPGVTLKECHGQASGFALGVAGATGSSANVLSSGANAPDVVDCLIEGGRDTGVTGSGRYKRVLFREGNDIFNLRLPSTECIECVFDGPKRYSAVSHSDCVQSTTNSPSTTIHVFLASRCFFNAFNRRTNDLHNSCIQLGAYGDPSGGCSGHVTDSLFDGGNYSINGSQCSVVFRGNRFRQNYRYGPVSSRDNSVDLSDPSNVWDHNGVPIST
jgi:hypothetical protein